MIRMNILRILLMMVSSVSAVNHFVISEVNSHERHDPHDWFEFVELQAFPPKDTEVSLRGLKLLVIRGGPIPRIEVVVNLYSAMANRKGFFTVGGVGFGQASNNNYKWDNNAVECSKKALQQPLMDMLPDGDEVPYGIAIIQSKGGRSRGTMVPNIPTFTTKKPYIYLDNPQLIEEIREAMKDLIVYGRAAATDGCQIFQDLYPPFEERAYLLREYDRRDGTLSLSRCTIEQYTFYPRSFQLGLPSPSERNKCDINFNPIIETNPQMPPVGDINEQEMEVEQQNDEGTFGGNELKGCRPTSRSQSYYEEQVNEDQIDQLIQESTNNEGCPVNNGGLESTMREELEIDKTNALIRRSFQGEGVIEDWDQSHNFKSSWIDFIRIHQSDIHPIDVLEMPNIRKWYVLYENEDDPAASRHGCSICRDNFDDMFLDPMQKSSFADVGGTLSSDIRNNRRDILRHEESTGHKMVIQSLKRRALARLPLALELEQQKTSAIIQQTDTSLVPTNVEVDLKATIQYIRSVFQGICKLNIAFNAFDKLVLLQELSGTNMGCLHANRYGALRTTEWLSNEFHKNLLDHIKMEEEPEMKFIALVCDEASDKSNRKFLSVNLQIFEGESVIMHNYRTIHLTDIVISAEYIFEVLTDSFRQDGIENEIKNHLVAITTDGASVMLALSEKMDNYVTGHKVHRVHCNSHTIQLSLNEVTSKKKHHKQYIQILNFVYVFYGEHKRKASLTKTSQEMGVHPIYPKKVIKIRWLPSLVVVMKHMDKGWKVLFNDLRRISNNKEYKKPVRNKAANLRKAIGNRSFVLYTFFFESLVKLMSEWTEFTQKTVGLLLEQVKKKNEIISLLMLMKDNVADELHAFYSEIECIMQGGAIYAKNEPLGICGETQYFAAQYVLWRGEYLLTEEFDLGKFKNVVNDDDDDGGDDNDDIVEGSEDADGFNIWNLRLKDIKIQIIDSLIDEINRYFPEGETDDWAVFDPVNFPHSPYEFLDYGLEQVETVAVSLGYESIKGQILEEWKALMDYFSSLQFMCNPKQREEDPTIFWPWALKQMITEEHNGHFSAIRRLIRHVINIPASSAEAERIFSQLKYIRYDRRSSLSPATIEHVVRCRRNGPNDLRRLNALDYAKRWIRAGKKRVDEACRKRTPTKETKKDEIIEKKQRSESSLY